MYVFVYEVWQWQRWLKIRNFSIDWLLGSGCGFLRTKSYEEYEGLNALKDTVYNTREQYHANIGSTLWIDIPFRLHSICCSKCMCLRLFLRLRQWLSLAAFCLNNQMNYFFMSLGRRQKSGKIIRLLSNSLNMRKITCPLIVKTFA